MGYGGELWLNRYPRVDPPCTDGSSGDGTTVQSKPCSECDGASLWPEWSLRNAGGPMGGGSADDQ
jgi:hypothetical protein